LSHAKLAVKETKWVLEGSQIELWKKTCGK
jgi:hypothetical protein